jgi:putative transcriptional regulator
MSKKISLGGDVVNPRYREVRLDKNMTLQQAAAPIGRSKQWLSEVERGNIELNYEDSIKLAKVYGGTPDIFLPIKSNNISQKDNTATQQAATLPKTG